MKPQYIGDPLFARDANGRLRTRIATAFPRQGYIVTVAGIHAMQRLALTDHLDAGRRERGQPPLTQREQEEVWMSGVDLVLDEQTVYVRPDPNDMPLAFEGDEMLQQEVSKKRIKFMHVLDPRVRQAVQRRGEYWRITPLPRSPEDMRQMIRESRIGIGGREIYYYGRASGTRLVTCQEFAGLAAMPEAELRKHLMEVRGHSARTNRLGNPELDFFMAEGAGLATAFAAYDFASMPADALRAAHQALERAFHDAVAPEFRRDDLDCLPWRNHMYAALIGQSDRAVSEEQLLGLADEFYMQVEWLPGGRIEDGELVLDSMFEEEAGAGCADVDGICDTKARGFIFNFIRDYGDLEYVNIGRVVGSLSYRKGMPGRRGVYVAEIKHRAADRPILRIIRMQKWGLIDRLDEGKDLLQAILESDEYTEFILDRRLGCRQLGMNLTRWVTARKVAERYLGRNARYCGIEVRSPYFERDYIPGVATDKVPGARFADTAYALAFSRLLGGAAAANLIVGRTNHQGQVIFDDGDELVVEMVGSPVKIVVADHTGTFNDYRNPLESSAAAYAHSINDRLEYLSDKAAFREAFLLSFVERFTQIQQDYRKRQRAFDTLFKHLPRNEQGSFAFRWEKVLARLAAADPTKLAGIIRGQVKG